MPWLAAIQPWPLTVRDGASAATIAVGSDYAIPIGSHNRLLDASPPRQDTPKPGQSPQKEGFWPLRFLRLLGPGLVTGAADDDQLGIALLERARSSGFGQLWTAGALPDPVAPRGSGGVRQDWRGHRRGPGGRHQGPRYSRGADRLVLLVVVANTINVSAGASPPRSEASALVVPVPRWALAVLTTGIVLGLEVFISYARYAKFLKWLAAARLSRRADRETALGPNSFLDLRSSPRVQRLVPVHHHRRLRHDDLALHVRWRASREVEER